MSFTVAMLLTPRKNAALGPWGSQGGGRWCTGAVRPGVSALGPAARLRRCRRRRFLRLQARGDRLRLGPPLAARRLLLLLPFRLRLDAGLGRVRHRFAFL